MRSLQPVSGALIALTIASVGGVGIGGLAHAAGELAPSAAGTPESVKAPESGSTTRAAPRPSPKSSQMKKSTVDFSMMSKMLEKPVLDRTGKKLGEVDDIILDAYNQPTQVVVTSGGFLGIGSKEVALPWNTISYDPGSNAIHVISLSEAKFQQMKEYKNRKSENSVRKKMAEKQLRDRKME